MGKGSRARRKPHTPPTQWDMGPDTLAQRANKVIEPATYRDPDTGRDTNPNGVKRARRVDLVEVYYRKGRISKRAWHAAQKLRDAWEATQRSAPAIKEIQVDSSPKPDAHIAIQVDRVSRFAWVMGKVPSGDRRIIEAVVLEDRTPAHVGYQGRRYHEGLQALSDALELLADKME